jgi:CubicO group peptidase (beta-lactamase class C family)
MEDQVGLRVAPCAVLLTLGAVLTASALGASADHSGKGADTPLSQVLEAAVAHHDAPGIVGLVVNRDEVVFAGAAGTLDGSAPLPVDAIFNIASMTKPVTTTAVMILMEQGKLSLEDPVSRYLPGFDHLEVITRFNEADGTYQTRPAKHVMTLRHLLTHTSGIGYGFDSPILARLQQGHPEKKEWELPLLHEPGEKWTYGASTRVLGLIVEKITGQTLEAYYQEHILRPLAMVDTSYAVPAEKQSRLIHVYSHVDGGFKEGNPMGAAPKVPTPPFRGDGGLYSTAQDYGRFMRMLLNGGHLGAVRILKEESVRLMAENQIGPLFVRQQEVGIPAFSKPFPLGAGQDKFGLGFQVTGASAAATPYRRPGSLSWAGIFNTEFWVDPKAGLGGVLLMQYLPFYDDAAIGTLREFEAAAYRQLASK